MSSETWTVVQSKVAELASKHNRPLTIVAVSKGQNAAKISSLLRTPNPPEVLGESYLAEALEKKKALSEFSNIAWHFIGKLQSRKILEIAASFSCIHTVGRIKELDVLKSSRVCPNFFLQVNTSNETQKNGFTTGELSAAINHVEALGLTTQLLGLMTLPSPLEDVGETQLRSEFSLLRQLRDQQLPGKLLNMGTSGDYEIAIDEGADWIRLGTIIFGERI